MFEEKARAFAGAMPELYEKYLVPLNFAPHAQVVAERAIALAPRRILELAAGTGVLTQALTSGLPPDISITATDLNDAMLDQARKRVGLDRVVWRQADALNLPFPDAAFDLVVCQFGVMFFPDKPESFREARRVLGPDGTYLFVLWDDYRDMPDSPLWVATQAVGAILGRDPLSLLNPGYFDELTIRADLAAGGFDAVTVDRVSRPSRAISAREAAVAAVHGSLLRGAVEADDPSRMEEATDVAELAIRTRLGTGRIEGISKAIFVSASGTTVP